MGTCELMVEIFKRSKCQCAQVDVHKAYASHFPILLTHTIHTDELITFDLLSKSPCIIMFSRINAIEVHYVKTCTVKTILCMHQIS